MHQRIWREEGAHMYEILCGNLYVQWTPALDACRMDIPARLFFWSWPIDPMGFLNSLKLAYLRLSEVSYEVNYDLKRRFSIQVSEGGGGEDRSL